MQTIDQLIHAKWIITCEETNRVLEDHAIAIDQGKILAILPSDIASSQYQTNHEERFPNHAILPGFINAHTHIAMNLFRGLADDLELMEWLTKYIWPAEGKWVSDEMVYDGSLLAIAEMLRGGITCFNDMYFFPDATARAAELAGIRAHIGLTIMNVPTAYAKTTEEYFAKCEAFLATYQKNDFIVPTLAPHSTYTVALEDLIRVKTLADKHDLKISLHLQEAPSEMTESLQKYGNTPLKRLHEAGLLSPQIIAVHMTQIDDEDFDILTITKPNIVHCPESNMKLNSGNCPVETLRKLHINVALGTDGAASNNDLDMIGEMRSAAFLGKITAGDPRAVSAEHVLKMATINGAKALGIDHMIGSLTAGKYADMIAIDLETVETQPLYQPISQIVYAAARQQVTDVWVHGRKLMRNRELTTLNVAELISKAKTWREHIKTI